MPIETLETHTLADWLGYLRSLNDCLDRSRCYVSKERWEQGKLEYPIEQLQKARKYLLRMEATCVAQQIEVQMSGKKVIGFSEGDSQ